MTVIEILIGVGYLVIGYFLAILFAKKMDRIELNEEYTVANLPFWMTFFWPLIVPLILGIFKAVEGSFWPKEKT